MSLALQRLGVVGARCDPEMGTRPETLGGLSLLGVVTWRLMVAATAGQSSSQCLSLSICSSARAGYHLGHCIAMWQGLICFLWLATY